MKMRAEPMLRFELHNLLRRHRQIIWYPSCNVYFCMMRYSDIVLTSNCFLKHLCKFLLFWSLYIFYFVESWGFSCFSYHNPSHSTMLYLISGVVYFFNFGLNFQKTWFKVVVFLFIFVKVIKFVPDFSSFWFPFSETLACIIIIFWNICYASVRPVLLTQVSVWYIYVCRFFSQNPCFVLRCKGLL